MFLRWRRLMLIGAIGGVLAYGVVELDRLGRQWKLNRALAAELSLEDGEPGHGYVEASVGTVAALVGQGADVNMRSTERRRTALYRASREADVVFVQTLIDRGADVNAATNEGHTPLMIAACYGLVDNLECLLAAGARIDAHAQDGATALMGAAISGNPKTIRLLLVHGAGLEAEDRDGRTPLLHAAECAQVENLRVLLDAGANREHRDHQGQSAADLALRVYRRLRGFRLRRGSTNHRLVPRYGEVVRILGARTPGK